MQITDVRVYHNENSKILASASITIEGKLVIKGIKVMMKNDGTALFVSMPSYKKKDGEWSDYVFSLDEILRNDIKHKVLGEYNNTKPQHNERTYKGQYTAPIEQPQKNEAQRKYDSIDVTEEDLPF
jgi:DNA-binding cell septation regulator SpoVG